jgi:DNA-binding winged helix-turn-helix (wHTH) protein/TolB-like protein/lipopolysaccharide biosynthesis regulator YciM
VRESVKPIYEFGPFRLDTVKRVLLREGEPVPLTSKVFDTLLVLVQHGGQLLTKDELIETLWPDSIVEESNLTQNISVLRKALGEGPDAHRYIVTVPGRGYKFVADVSEVGSERVDLIVTERARAWTVVEEEASGKEWGSGRVGERESVSLTHSPILLTLIRPFTHSPIRPFLIFVLVGLAAALSYFWLRSPSQPTEPLATVKSIVVLPFKLLSGDDSDAYLGLGMADTLITKLSNIQQLIVRPTSAVRKYTNPEQDPLAAGREQQVDTVLEGSIRQSGERIRVTVRLLNVRDGSSLWAGQFDERLTDIFTVEDAISDRVTESLAMKLTGEQRAALAKRSTENVEAYQLYLKGLILLSRRTNEAMRKAIDYFEQAIGKDPNYALAYTALAQSYALLPIAADVRPAEALPKAKEAAMRAIEIDEALAEAHDALAAIKFYELDWSGAERESKRAIELNPNLAGVHMRYAHTLSNLGKHSEAIAEVKRALELDPLSMTINSRAGMFLYYARQYDQAIEQLQKTLELYSTDWAAHIYLGKVYEQKRMYKEAMTEFQKAQEISGNTLVRSLIGHAHAVLGQRDDAQRMVHELKEMSKQRYVPPQNIALIYLGLGENDQVFEWLEKAYEERDVLLTFLKVHPQWDVLRTDPRFADLLRRIGLAP